MRSYCLILLLLNRGLDIITFRQKSTDYPGSNMRSHRKNNTGNGKETGRLLFCLPVHCSLEIESLSTLAYGPAVSPFQLCLELF